MKKQALVTGATSGIGRATALRLSVVGYDIIATGRRADRLAELKASIEAQGGACRTLCFDIRSEEECKKFLEPIEQVDLLVNNAGLAAGLEHIDQGSTADWDAMIDTNVKGSTLPASSPPRWLLPATATSSTSVRSPVRSLTKTERSTALRNTPYTPSLNPCVPTF